MPHEDGVAYYPLVATVSLGAPIMLDVYEKSGNGEENGNASPRDIASCRRDAVCSRYIEKHLYGFAAWDRRHGQGQGARAQIYL
ncbi:hypothetical protein BO70DRAFT_362431 [Aspergillus heteromorphus CBS 117.55]|uniref:Uncharacterized protein n=1 Tax=Aspergillus heteromorphus CBS 117.55 TaxID=1448321 RepID=A0A317W578_9EURO|nr:uncharacterized protein BO70DRAFT_362431 [Aspergillus heteromorphus CBS 117.55]PWY80482.1 hypothetical protein BO70DRAFT_362431 [Aspergillus heteromorphus CBS 117.55]